MKRVCNDFKLQLEKDSKLRTRKIKKGDTVVIVQLSPEEAVEQFPEWKNFLSKHNRKYE